VDPSLAVEASNTIKKKQLSLLVESREVRADANAEKDKEDYIFIS
jgi:hypothetical protein